MASGSSEGPSPTWGVPGAVTWIMAAVSVFTSALSLARAPFLTWAISSLLHLIVLQECQAEADLVAEVDQVLECSGIHLGSNLAMIGLWGH